MSAWAACTSGKSYDLTGRGDATYTFSVKATDAAGNTGVAGTSGYTLDTTAPAAPAITGPSSPGSTRSPSWSFTGEAGAAFQCQLDRGGTIVSGWAACTSAKAYDLTGQPDGAYTVSVRATDQAGNTGAVGTSGYTLDTTAPSAPTITSAPSSPGTTRDPSWSFTAEVGATFQCRLDRGATMISAWAPCSSGDTYDLTAQPDGAYTISVKAIDAAGNAGAATTSSYTLDTTAPAASTVTPPASPGNSRTPAWSFTSEAGATYQCQLDRGGTIVSAWAICTSAKTYSLSGQPDGTYTMSVKGTDQAGNTGPTTTGDYTLDTTAPSTPSIDSGPGASGSGLNPAWSFSGDPGASFDCRLTDGGTVVSDWATCSTSKTYDLSGASDGTYTFAVRSSDGAGNTGSSATYDYTLVTSRPPAPSIDTPEASPGNTTTPSWDFSISEAGDTTECKLARGASVLSDWTACTSPHAYDLGGQPDGTYTFSVRGKNGVGTLGPETAADYVLDTQSPSTPTISASPASPGRSSSPSWTFGGDAGASFQCKADRGGTIVSDWASCSSPKSYDLSGEADGSYTFSVRALDPAGNTSSAATSGYGFDTTAPAPPVFGGTPGAAGTNVTPSWAFTAEPGATLECRLDRGAAAVYGWTACASPRGYDLLSQPDATYTISVRATDQAGNVGTAGASSYQLLTAQPGLPTITSTPGVGGNGRSPAWSFSGDAGALLECRLDRGASAVSDWSTCASPRGFDLTGLPDGAYTFSVRARNFVGTAGPAATSGYVLDTVPPAVPALDASQGAVGRSRRPAWGFSSDAGTLFECQLTRPAHILADWHACASPQSADLSAQPDDDYSFAVRAVDSVGNRSAARSGAYELDTDPPAAPSIDSSPGAKGTDTSPKWSFSGERGATFECKLSRVDDWSACTSPRSYDISKQGAGDYTFSVRATDKAGNTGPAKTDDYTLQASSSSGGGSSDSPAATPPAADTPASKGPDQTPSPPSNSKDATTRAQAKRAERAAAKAGTKSLHQLKTTLAHVLPHISAPRGTQAAAQPAHKAHKTAAGKAVAAVAQNVKRAAAVVAKNADKSVFPGSLMFIVFGFLSIQGRIDRNDPKLALAPTYDEPDLGFDPPPSDK